MKTFVSPRHRVAIVLLATLVTVGACGGQPSDDTDGRTDPNGSAAPPDASPSEPAGPTEPDPRPDEPDDPGGPGDDGRILPPDGPGTEVVWIEDSLYVVFPGSSACPPTARSVEVVSDTEWVIDVTPRTGTGAVCTADLVPHRSRIEAPSNADPDAEVMATILNHGERSEPVPVTVHDAPDQ